MVFVYKYELCVHCYISEIFSVENLNYQVHLGMFTDEQHDVVMETLIYLFCKRHHNVRELFYHDSVNTLRPCGDMKVGQPGVSMM